MKPVSKDIKYLIGWRAFIWFRANLNLLKYATRHIIANIANKSKKTVLNSTLVNVHICMLRFGLKFKKTQTERIYYWCTKMLNKEFLRALSTWSQFYSYFIFHIISFLLYFVPEDKMKNWILLVQWNETDMDTWIA